SVEVPKACYKGVAVAGFELMERRAVDKPRDDLVDVVALAQVGANDVIHRRRIDARQAGHLALPRRLGLAPGEAGDYLTADGQRMFVVDGFVVGDPADSR